MKKICMVGNTHFDPVWLWRWNEAMSSITATFRSALERMKEYPDFKYSFSAPAVFEWIKNTDRELFEEIKQRVKEGRWELCEGWWLQPDCCSALGESYVRQGLYAQQYLDKNFGKRSKTVFNIDSFGHPGTLPQILAGCGIENYVFWRPNEEHKHLDTPLFVWKGENGTSVRTYRIGGDGGEIFTADITEETLNPLIENMENIPHDLMVVYGVTDHGGAPTKAMIEKILEKKEQIKDSAEMKFSGVEEFFDGADMSGLPEIEDELLVKFIGPYSNNTQIKKNNRHAEYAVMNAEKAAVLAEKLLGREYPKDKIRECWQDIMFNQFHDILGGCCIKDAYFDARNLHGRAIQTSDEITHFSLQSITNKIKMPGKNPDNAWNLVVWNLNGTEFDGEIEAEVQWAWEFDWYDGGIELADSDGNIVPCQIIDELSVIPKFRSRFVFKAKIPPLGYKCFVVKQTGPRKAAEKQKKAENGRFSVEYGADGVKSVYDKHKKKQVLSAMLVPYAVEDECDTWGFNKMVYEPEKHFMTLKNCRIKESGEIRTTLRLEWEYNKSCVEQEISIYESHIDCRYRALWNEEKKALKFMVSGGKKMKTVCSAPYGRTQRQASEYEKPMGEWIKLYDGTDNISVLSDSVFAYNFDGESLGLTVLRNCIFGDLRTEPLDESKTYSYMGQGETEGRIRIVFECNEDIEGIHFNNPPVIICEANHGGELNPVASFADVPQDIALCTVKRAEDGRGYVLRLYNTKSEKQCGNVTLFGNSCNVELNPHEVQTLRTVQEGFCRVNMREESDKKW